MRRHRYWCAGMLIVLHTALGCAAPPRTPPVSFSAMAWNILHGGRDDGDTVGPQRVIDILRASGADVVAMQETYGSGELIAGALGFRFHPRGTNVSIHSRYPIVEDVSVHEPFKCVGAIIELPGGERIAFYSIWLPYGAEIWEEGTRDGLGRDALLAACAPSRDDLAAIADGLEARLAEAGYAGIPVIVAGDFNSMSHLDYTDAAVDQYGVVVDWPTSRVLTERGFVDTYRALHPDVDRHRDRTWTPRFPAQEADRIDFVYARGAALTPRAARIIDTHPETFPSDHAAVVVEFSVASNPR